MKAWIKTIRQLFSSEELTRLARKVGFIQRQRSLTAEAFLTLCAWGDGSLACQSLQRLCADLALWHDCSLSNEGLNQRFTPRAVAFLKEVFFTLLMHQRPALSSITETYRACFTRLRILDSTSFLLPADYGEDYQGSVSSGAKIQFEYELLSGFIGLSPPVCSVVNEHLTRERVLFSCFLLGILPRFAWWPR
ncbi:hypothetical protein [Parageobacillus galactosidasius]|uniref:hypothetical protein n=1 Tax=Parageobacillus galactosidasius TaxID=883812 RepID=UPI001FE4D49B|nr:hypothetical protein [Parageobacillus galactosidasius]